MELRNQLGKTETFPSTKYQHYLVKLEMALEESNKVWLDRRVRVNPYRKFFPLKKVKKLVETAPSGR